jgi:DNA repair protein RecO (recombination protein O)
MSTLVTTAAVVLRTHRYSESSKIVRLATRELGVQSAIAKGALRPKSPFGAGLELLSEGVAQLYYRDTRDLQTLAGFDVVALRRELAADLARFSGAAALAEIMVKMAPPAPLPAAYDTLVGCLDALAGAGLEEGEADAVGVRALWRLLGVLGFEPALLACVRDGVALHAASASGWIVFSTAEGGVLCGRCADARPPGSGSRLPAAAFRDLVALNNPGAPLPRLDVPHAAAHRRLVARFARHHMGDDSLLPALDFWERRAWAVAS